MKVNALRRILGKLDGDLEIRVDNDKNGFFDLEAVEINTEAEEEDSFVNLITNNTL